MPEAWVPVQGGAPLSLQGLSAAADELLTESGNRRVWLFYGELGTGKTTLIKILAKKLGVDGGMSSPSFSIVNTYVKRDGGVIYHFDFYRLQNEREAFDIGTEEYFDSGNYCFVEWPEKIPSLVPMERFEVRLIPVADPERRIFEFCRHD